jgi:predicted nucleic acid-binding protein
VSGVIVDTSAWSIALRRKPPREQNIASELAKLIDENRAKIIGPIRQELLSGYSDHNRYETLRSKLAYFPNESIIEVDYETAAEYSNLCRKKGVQGSHTDFLICAVSIRLKMSIYTTDKDFLHYQKHLPLSLHDER